MYPGVMPSVCHMHHHSLLEIIELAKWTEMKVSKIRAIRKVEGKKEELFGRASCYRAFDFLITKSWPLATTDY